MGTNLSPGERELLLCLHSVGALAVRLGSDPALAALLNNGLADAQLLGPEFALVFLTPSGHDVAVILLRASK